MDELGGQQLSNLAQTAERAAAIRQWLTAPAYGYVKAEMNELAGRDCLKWLAATPEEAEKMRQAALPYAKFFQVIASLLLKGDQAAKALEQHKQRQFETPPSRDGQGA
jgi:hypothetical protein